MITSLFDRTVSFLSKSLDMMSVRHQLIASNIANQDTPNYRSKDINFKDEIERAMNMDAAGSVYRTDPRHMPVNSPDMPDISSGLITESDSGSGYDKNSVNVEIEMAHMARNTIMYNAAAQIITNKFRWLSYAIKEGR